LEDWWEDGESQSQSQSIDDLLEASSQSQSQQPKPMLVRKNAFCFEMPQQPEKPALVSEVCFCIFLSCVLVLVL